VISSRSRSRSSVDDSAEADPVIKIKTGDFVQARWAPRGGRPAFFLALSHATKTLVLCIRGELTAPKCAT
jgi:hypothetical protein